MLKISRGFLNPLEPLPYAPGRSSCTSGKISGQSGVKGSSGAPLPHPICTDQFITISLPFPLSAKEGQVI